MSRSTKLKIIAPLVAAITAASYLFLASAPEPVRADISVPLIQGTPSLSPMLKKVMPAVVNISVTSKAEIQNPLMQDPFFRRFFEGPETPAPR